MIIDKIIIILMIILIKTMSRYDWMRDEPNDWHGQNCLTFLKDQVTNYRVN